MEGNFQVRNFGKFGYTLRGCPLSLNGIQSSLEISGKLKLEPSAQSDYLKNLFRGKFLGSS